MKANNKSSCYIKSILILTIPFLFLVGIGLGFIGVFNANVELHTFGIIAFIYIVFILFVRHNASYVMCHMRQSFLTMEEDLQGAIKTNALSIMGETKSTLNISEFIEDYYRDIRNDNFAKVAPSVFPMLGILGTFIAIAISMPDFTVQDTSSLDKEISILLSGIGTAFYASIYGILLSLVWTFFEKMGLAKIDEQFSNVEKIYAPNIWRDSELIKHQHMQSSIKDNEMIGTLKDIFNIDFIKELNAQNIKHFTTILKDSTGTFSELTQHINSASIDLRETLKMIDARSQTTNAINLIGDNIEGFNKNSLSLQNSMEKFDLTVENTFVKIDEELAKSIEKLSIFSSIVSEQNMKILSQLDDLKIEKK